MENRLQSLLEFRTALLLIGANKLSYEQAAPTMAMPKGTGLSRAGTMMRYALQRTVSSRRSAGRDGSG
jgi:hypothetical protein